MHWYVTSCCCYNCLATAIANSKSKCVRNGLNKENRVKIARITMSIGSWILWLYLLKTYCKERLYKLCCGLTVFFLSTAKTCDIFNRRVSVIQFYHLLFISVAMCIVHAIKRYFEDLLQLIVLFLLLAYCYILHIISGIVIRLNNVMCVISASWLKHCLLDPKLHSELFSVNDAAIHSNSGARLPCESFNITCTHRGLT